MSFVFFLSLSLCYSNITLPFPQMDDSNFISWTYLGNGAVPDAREFSAVKGTVVEYDMDIFIPNTKTKRKERTFYLDGKEGNQLKGYYFVVQDGTRKKKRIEISRNCAHIRVHGKCMICCISNPTIIKT